jgi:hypothetical protein
VAEPIVVNTGPLGSFARIGCLDVIGRLPYVSAHEQDPPLLKPTGVFP